MNNDEEKIGCVKCLNPDYILLDGKCYAPIDNCKKYESYLNEKEEVKIRCSECNDKYEMNQFNRCNKKEIKINNCVKTNEDINNPKCLECQVGFDLFENQCIKKISLVNGEIEGCLNYETQYGYNYCKTCNSNYFYYMGNCIEKYKSIFLKSCERYSFENGLFECIDCQFYRGVRVSNHLLCNTDIFSNCQEIVNLGPDTRPKYSCNKCYSGTYALIEDENNVKLCIYGYSFDERCYEGKRNTSYYKDIYSCTKCREPFILSYNDYYERKICKDIYEEEKKSENKIEDYELDEGISSVNGICGNGYFTRNGKVCIKCDDINIGMPGCEGNCNFKINREYQLKCESNKCKIGYFEILPGQCELCNNTIPGCSKCEYVENTEKHYGIIEPIRKRELICIDNCEGDNIFKIGNNCLKCSEILIGCLECINDNDVIKCKKALTGYYIDKNGKSVKCVNNCLECKLEIEDNDYKVKCLKPSNSDYFINSKGELKYCDDYYEGIQNCETCTKKDGKLSCSICSTGFVEISGICYSCDEVLDNKGCLYCRKDIFDDSIKCNNCIDNMVLISNLGKCYPKNEEIENCLKANFISENENYFYNCSSCNSGYSLIKEAKNKTNCYDRNDIGEVKNYCSILISLKTRLNPIFSCQKCYPHYTNVINESQIQTCVYAENELQFCLKGESKQIFDEENNIYKTEYNCTECEEHYELEYNNSTKKTICKPIECLSMNCEVCKDNEVYICKECKIGYVFSKLNECIIKPEITPNIHFKDIYRFALNGNTKINGEDIFGPIYTIRGLTKEDIVEMHSFIVLSIFKLEEGLRNLDETKQFKSYCIYKNKIISSETILKLVDYECIVDSEYQDLTNYKLNQIIEGQYLDSSNLNSYDLENLVSQVQDLTKYDSSFLSSDLDKYIYFIIDDNNINNKFETNITGIFNFTIRGKTDKDSNKNIFGELKIREKNDIKAYCNVNASNKEDALLNCEINLKTILNNNSDEIITFEDDEIKSEQHNILFSGMNNIEILKFKMKAEIMPIEDIKEDEKEKETKKKKNTSLIIGLTIGFGIPIIGVLIFLIIFYYKKKRSKINQNENQKVSRFKEEGLPPQSERNNNLS